LHKNGEVLMGAMWKVRHNLQQTHGDGPGGDIANALFLGWMNSYDQTTIDSIILTQWLTLDDDNGDIYDGTPNHDDIESGFVAQGFPAIEPAARFVGEPRAGSEPLVVAFSDESTGHGLSDWFWEFGDGMISKQRNPTHEYRRPGRYTVSLRVTGILGSDTETKPDYVLVEPGVLASVFEENGLGINPNVFSTVTLPVVGTTWWSVVDGGSVGAEGPTFVVGHAAALRPGIVGPVGELLIDPQAAWLATSVSDELGGISKHAIEIPADAALVGLPAFTQGLLHPPREAPRLTNALYVILGR